MEEKVCERGTDRRVVASRDEQVGRAVVVVVAPRDAVQVSGGHHFGRREHTRVVVIEVARGNDRKMVGHVQIEPSIVVVVSPSGADRAVDLLEPDVVAHVDEHRGRVRTQVVEVADANQQQRANDHESEIRAHTSAPPVDEQTCERECGYDGSVTAKKAERWIVGIPKGTVEPVSTEQHQANDQGGHEIANGFVSFALVH